MLKKQDAEEIIELIMQRIAQLNDQLEHHESDHDESRTQHGDNSAIADRQISSQMDSNIREAASNELRRLEQNMSWLNGDTAGLCEQCGASIPMARLKAVIDTRLCIDCASRQHQETGIG